MIADVSHDRHAERIAESVSAGRLTVQEGIRLAVAVGRLQGAYMSAATLAAEAGLVCDANTARKRRVEE